MLWNVWGMVANTFRVCLFVVPRLLNISVNILECFKKLRCEMMVQEHHSGTEMAVNR